MRALLNVYYCLDDTTLSCVCERGKKAEKRHQKRMSKGIPQHDDGVFFSFFDVYVYENPFSLLLPRFKMLGLAKCAFTWGWFPVTKNREALLSCFARSNDGWGVKGGPWKNTFLYLAFLKQPAIR